MDTFEDLTGLSQEAVQVLYNAMDALGDAFNLLCKKGWIEEAEKICDARSDMYILLTNGGLKRDMLYQERKEDD